MRSVGSWRTFGAVHPRRNAFGWCAGLCHAWDGGAGACEKRSGIGGCGSCGVTSPNQPFFSHYTMVTPKKLSHARSHARTGSASEASSDEGPRPDCIRDGAIDTGRLADRPLGPQKGRKGPACQKFLCSQCLRKRWIMDSAAGCAADLTRFSTCLFCDLRGEFDGKVLELKSSFVTQVAELRDSVGACSRASAGTSTLAVTPTDLEELRKEVRDQRSWLEAELAALRTSIDSSIKELCSEMAIRVGEMERSAGRRREELEPFTPTPAPRLSLSPGEPPPRAKRIEDLETFMDVSYRRFSLMDGPGPGCPAASRIVSREGQTGRVEASEMVGDVLPPLLPHTYAAVAATPPAPAPRRERDRSPAPRERAGVEDEGRRGRRRREPRRRGKKKNRAETRSEPAAAAAPPTRGAPPPTQKSPQVLLLGDSLVGGQVGRLFSEHRQDCHSRAFPGARVLRVKGEVDRITLDRNSTLVLSVGGNDLFREENRLVPTEELIWHFTQLLSAAKKKVGRCVLVGIVPRRYSWKSMYDQARVVNARLASLCREMSLRFVDPWRMFFGKDWLFVRDGVHFSKAGAQEFTSLLTSRLFKPVAVEVPAAVRPRTATEGVSREGQDPPTVGQRSSRKGPCPTCGRGGRGRRKGRRRAVEVVDLAASRSPPAPNPAAPTPGQGSTGSRGEEGATVESVEEAPGRPPPARTPTPTPAPRRLRSPRSEGTPSPQQRPVAKKRRLEGNGERDEDSSQPGNESGSGDVPPQGQPSGQSS